MTVLSRNLWRSFAAATLALALGLSLPQSAQAGLDVLLRGFCCDVFCGNPDEAHWSDWPLSGTCFSDQLESNSLVHCCEKLENECTGFLISEEFSRTAQTRFYGCVKSQKTGTIRDVNPGKSLTDPRYQGPAEAL